MKQPNIVLVGHACIDRNNIEGEKYTKWGGPTIFMAKYFEQAFNSPSTIIASYGDDLLSYVDGVTLYPGKPNIDASLVFENTVTDGRRTQRCQHADIALPAEIDSSAKKILAECDILIVGALTPCYTPSSIASLMSAVRKNCLTVLSPQGYFRDIKPDGSIELREFVEASEVIPQFDLVVLSDEDHPNAFDRAHEWKQFGPKTEIIVTRNAHGADIITNDGTINVPTNPVANKDIVDPVGAGDVFTAATAYHLRQHGDLTGAIKSGHAAAREKLLTPRIA
jgi:sugar/nucleoside kinase (ribokinase family)